MTAKGKAKKHRQGRALGALLVTNTQAEAAEVSGLSVRTIERYMSDPAFVQRLDDMRGEVNSDLADRLKAITGRALDLVEPALQLLDEQTRASLGDFVKVRPDGTYKIDLKGGNLAMVRRLEEKKYGTAVELHDAQGAAKGLVSLIIQLIESRRNTIDLEEQAARLDAVEEYIRSQPNGQK